MTSAGRAAEFAARWDVPLRAVESGPGALAALPAVLDRFVPIAELALVVDGTPKTYRDGAGAQLDVDAAVRRLLPAGVAVRTVTAVAGEHGPVLDEATVAAGLDAACGASLLLAVGSGTVADLAKQVAAELDVPVVVVQTAASVNGYADSLSVLVRNGAKRTAPSTWPQALVVDHDVLRGAPDRLTRAGVGDATAAWTAPADWYLACALGLDRAFDGGVLAPVLDAAEGLLTADPDTPEALTALVDTLTLGGLAIGATGTTAGLSGCEHLVSHLLDMAAMADGTAHDLHGAQVGWRASSPPRCGRSPSTTRTWGRSTRGRSRRPTTCASGCTRRGVGSIPAAGSGRSAGPPSSGSSRRGPRTAATRRGSSAAGPRTRRSCAATPTCRRCRPGRWAGGAPRCASPT